MKLLPLATKKKIHRCLKYSSRICLAAIVGTLGTMAGIIVWHNQRTPEAGPVAQAAQKAGLEADIERLGKMRDRYEDIHGVTTTLDESTAGNLGIAFDKTRLAQTDEAMRKAYAEAVRSIGLRLTFGVALSNNDFAELAKKLAETTPKEFIPGYINELTTEIKSTDFLQGCRREVMSRAGFAATENAAQEISNCATERDGDMASLARKSAGTLTGLWLGAVLLRRRWNKSLPKEEQALLDAEKAAIEKAAHDKAAEQKALKAGIARGTAQDIKVKPIRIKAATPATGPGLSSA